METTSTDEEVIAAIREDLGKLASGNGWTLSLLGEQTLDAKSVGADIYVGPVHTFGIRVTNATKGRGRDLLFAVGHETGGFRLVRIGASPDFSRSIMVRVDNLDADFRLLSMRIDMLLQEVK